MYKLYKPIFGPMDKLNALYKTHTDMNKPHITCKISVYGMPYRLKVMWPEVAPSMHNPFEKQ